ncbi:MAG: thioredoxin domain-containing protein [Candidatus Magasanikbacteria bacterium]
MSTRHPAFWKIFFIILGVVTVGIICLFIAFFIFYSWQFKFGTRQKITEITQKFEEKFSSISDDTGAPDPVVQPELFIHENNPTYGTADAPITIISFSDFECPYSQEQQEVISYLMTTYQPVIRIVFKHMPLESIHEHAQSAALTSMCANEQGKFWEYADILFKTKQLDDTSLFNSAGQIGVDIQKFNTCFTNKTFKKVIDQDLLDSQTLKLRGTPTNIVNGEVIEGVKTKEQWDEIIVKHLNNAK